MFASEWFMSTKTRREREKEQMRRRILDAAKQLFVKEGFDNVSMRRIAGRIEYSPAAIYRYFANKREILSVLREEGFARYVERQKMGVEAYPDPLERLREGGRGYIRFALSEPEYYHLMFSSSCDQVDMEGKWSASSIASYSNFKATAEECIATGYFGVVEVDTRVFGLRSGVHGLAHPISTGQVDMLEGDLGFDTFLDNIITFWMRPGGKESNQ